MENKKPRVGIFWDIDNVTIPSHFTALETINAIEAYASTFGEVKLSNIKVYYDPSERLHQKHTKDFFNKNINLTVICKDKPQIGDMAMISDMWSFAYDNKGHSIVIVIVTGDSDFARVITQMEQKDDIIVRLILPNQNVDKSLETAHAKRLSWVLDTYVPKKVRHIDKVPMKMQKHDRQFHEAKSSPLKWKTKYRGLRISTDGKCVSKSRGEDGIAILGSIWKNKDVKYTCKFKIAEKRRETDDSSPIKPKNLFWLGVIDKNTLDPQHRGSLMDYNSKCWAVNSAIDKLNDGGLLKKIGKRNNCVAKDGSVIEMTLENGSLKFNVDGVDVVEMKGIVIPVVPAVSLARRHVEIEVIECN